MQIARWIVLTVLAATGTASGQEPVLLSEDAGGILELEGERRIEVSGLQGTLSVRLGKDGEMRFASRSTTDRTVERPVALWLDGTTLRLTPLAGAAGEPVRLEVSVPASLDAFVEASDSTVQLASLHGTVRVRGERLELISRTLAGSLEVDVREGTVQATGIGEELSLEGADLRARVEHVVGSVTLNVDGGQIDLTNLRHEINGDVENVDLTAEGIVGRVRLHAAGGSLTLGNAEAGAELRLIGTPLSLLQTKGPIEVETDAPVRFQEHDGPLVVRARDAAVTGNGISTGPLEIATSGAEVRLDELEATTTIRGDNLDVRASGCGGELTIEAVYSTIVIDKAEKPVHVSSEFGDVEIHGAAQLVEVTSREGVVRIEDQRGPVWLTAEGPEVSVHWSAMNTNETSTIENRRGDVYVSVPTTHHCNVDLEAPHGTIETDIEDLQLSDDGHYGSGVLAGGGRPVPYVKRPTIRVASGGNLFFNGTDGAAEDP